MEFIFEFIVELYIELMMFVIPEEKASKYRWLVILIAATVLIVVFALVIWGIVLINKGDTRGWIPISVAVILSLIQIIAGIYVQSKDD